jgi:hypothetical protein
MTTPLGQNFKEPDIARGIGVGAAAELLAEGTDRHHPDLSTVFLAEQRCGTIGHCLVARLQCSRDRGVFTDTTIDPLLNPDYFLLRQRGKMGEVKTKPFLLNQRTGLLDVIPQDLLHGGMQKMRGRMVEGNVIATRRSN